MIINKVAAIDIGSNAVRLLISRIKEQSDGSWSLKKELLLRVPLRLGEDSFITGEISQKQEVRLIKVMKSFYYLIGLYQVDVYYAYATAAMREAKNGNTILLKVKEKANIDVKMITGAKEAILIYESHAAHLMQDDHNYLYADVGGGSTEISLIVKGVLADSKSFKVGTIRMLSDKVENEEIEEMIEYLSDIKKNFAPVQIIGSGGNINKLYRLSKTEKNKPLSTKKLQELYLKLSKLTNDERISMYDLNPDRADVIVPACEIFLLIAQSTEIKDILVPNIGLVDGIVCSIIEDVKNKKKENKSNKAKWLKIA